MALSAADGDGRVNYFMPMADDEHYGALLKHIFDGGDLFEAMDLATQLEMSLDSADYPEWMKDAALARALMIVARYCTQISDSYDGIASGYMSDADGLVASSREKGAPESVVGVLEALSNSFWYLIDGSLSKAMKFPSAVDRLYKEHPEDFHVLLMAADRYLHSPGIAGGNKKKGLALFQEAEAVMDECGAAPWDRFTIYSGLAFGYDARKQDEEARKYAELAYAIYTADGTVNSILGI